MISTIATTLITAGLTRGVGKKNTLYNTEVISTSGTAD
jgi:hypothetical protein